MVGIQRLHRFEIGERPRHLGSRECRHLDSSRGLIGTFTLTCFLSGHRDKIESRKALGELLGFRLRLTLYGLNFNRLQDSLV